MYGLLELQSVIVETIRIFCNFYIECTETALVLQNATQDTLVILDELSLDVSAIAYVVRFRSLMTRLLPHFFGHLIHISNFQLYYI